MAKVVLVAGASSGIGLATALELHRRGYLVYGAARSIEKMELPFSRLFLDVSDPAGVQAAVQQVIAGHGRIDVLINCFGYSTAVPAELATEDEMKEQMDTNFFGMVRMIKSVVPHMRTGGGGKIINISSIGGLFGLPFYSLYCASKFAVEALSESLSMELAPFHIKVYVVSPGDANTSITLHKKIGKLTNDGHPYQAAFMATLKKSALDERNGLSASAVAKTIIRAVESDLPVFRRIPASPLQRLSVFLKRVLPYYMFRNMLLKYYRASCVSNQNG